MAKKGRFKKPPAGKGKADKKQAAAAQAALDAALAQGGNGGTAGPAVDTASGTPASAAPMTDDQRMISRYGAGRS